MLRSATRLMRRSVLSGLLTSAGLSAASLGGSLFDAGGAPIADAKASVVNPETALKQEATTGPKGQFAFKSLPAGQYILRVEKPGYPSVYRVFSLKQDDNVDRGMVVGQPDRNPPSTPHQIRVDGHVQESKLIHVVHPIYPRTAKTAGVQGLVLLDVVISAEGEPQDIRVVASPSDDLTQSALEAVRQWRYSTTLLNGDPAPVVTQVVVNYTLIP